MLGNSTLSQVPLSTMPTTAAPAISEQHYMVAVNQEMESGGMVGRVYT